MDKQKKDRLGTERENGRALQPYFSLRNKAISHIGSDYKTIRSFAFLMIIADTGLSPEDVRTLEMENMDYAPSIGIISCRSRGINGDSCISVTLHKTTSEIFAAYLESRRAWLEEYSVDSPYLFPSRLTVSGIMPPEAIDGIIEIASKICMNTIDINLIRETFGPPQ
jgi:hypothetical protein